MQLVDKHLRLLPMEDAPRALTFDPACPGLGQAAGLVAFVHGSGAGPTPGLVRDLVQALAAESAALRIGHVGSASSSRHSAEGVQLRYVPEFGVLDNVLGLADPAAAASLPKHIFPSVQKLRIDVCRMLVGLDTYDICVAGPSFAIAYPPGKEHGMQFHAHHAQGFYKEAGGVANSAARQELGKNLYRLHLILRVDDGRCTPLGLEAEGITGSLAMPHMSACIMGLAGQGGINISPGCVYWIHCSLLACGCTGLPAGCRRHCSAVPSQPCALPPAPTPTNPQECLLVARRAGQLRQRVSGV